MGENEMIDQSVLSQDVSSKIPYQFLDFFLVKPLDPIKVKKEFSKPVATGKPSTDENGIEAQDFDGVETEIKEVDSDYRRGIVLKRPIYWDHRDQNQAHYDINIGDIILFREAAGLRFDLLKDSRLIRQYDILGIEK